MPVTGLSESLGRQARLVAECKMDCRRNEGKTVSLKTISAQDKPKRIAAIRKEATADVVAIKTSQTPDGKTILNNMVQDTIEKFYVAADHFARHVCEKEI